MLSIVAALIVSGQVIEDLPADCSQATGTAEMNACGERDLQREVRRMEAYLAAARSLAADADAASKDEDEPTRQVVYLTDSQTAWTAYVASACDGVYDQWKDGSIRGVMYLGCKMEMTWERTRVIWRDYLASGDTARLPEPVSPLSRP